VGPKVLVVDDEAEVRQVLSLVLDPVCEVLTASNGMDALRLIRKEKPRLVLLDVSMTEMGGLGLLKAVRACDPALAVVMLSGRRDLRVVKRALDGGARAYITKPFEAAALREEIRRLLADLGASKAPDRPWRVAPC
jgi:DNA-binding NtrC family response regulator